MESSGQEDLLVGFDPESHSDGSFAHNAQIGHLKTKEDSMVECEQADKHTLLDDKTIPDLAHVETVLSSDITNATDTSSGSHQSDQFESVTLSGTTPSESPSEEGPLEGSLSKSPAESSSESPTESSSESPTESSSESPSDAPLETPSESLVKSPSKTSTERPLETLTVPTLDTSSETPTTSISETIIEPTPEPAAQHQFNQKDQISVLKTNYVVHCDTPQPTSLDTTAFLSTDSEFQESLHSKSPVPSSSTSEPVSEILNSTASDASKDSRIHSNQEAQIPTGQLLRDDGSASMATIKSTNEAFESTASHILDAGSLSPLPESLNEILDEKLKEHLINNELGTGLDYDSATKLPTIEEIHLQNDKKEEDEDQRYLHDETFYHTTTHEETASTDAQLFAASPNHSDSEHQASMHDPSQDLITQKLIDDIENKLDTTIVAGLTIDIPVISADLTAKEKLNQYLHDLIDKLTLTIKEKDLTLAAKDRTIRDLNKKLNEQNETIMRLHHLLSARDALIENLGQKSDIDVQEELLREERAALAQQTTDQSNDRATSPGFLDLSAHSNEATMLKLELEEAHIKLRELEHLQYEVQRLQRSEKECQIDKEKVSLQTCEIEKLKGLLRDDQLELHAKDAAMASLKATIDALRDAVTSLSSQITQAAKGAQNKSNPPFNDKQRVLFEQSLYYLAHLIVARTEAVMSVDASLEELLKHKFSEQKDLQTVPKDLWGIFNGIFKGLNEKFYLPLLKFKGNMINCAQHAESMLQTCTEQKDALEARMQELSSVQAMLEKSALEEREDLQNLLNGKTAQLDELVEIQRQSAGAIQAEKDQFQAEIEHLKQLLVQAKADLKISGDKHATVLNCSNGFQAKMNKYETDLETTRQSLADQATENTSLKDQIKMLNANIKVSDKYNVTLSKKTLLLNQFCDLWRESLVFASSRGQQHDNTVTADSSVAAAADLSFKSIKQYNLLLKLIKLVESSIDFESLRESLETVSEEDLSAKLILEKESQYNALAQRNKQLQQKIDAAKTHLSAFNTHPELAELYAQLSH